MDLIKATVQYIHVYIPAFLDIDMETYFKEISFHASTSCISFDGAQQ